MYIMYKTPIDSLLILVPQIFQDNRGCFFESFSGKSLEACGVDFKVCQENHIMNFKRGVFRGLHFQNNPGAQAKLVRCIKGRVWDVAVDLRKDSQTYLKWYAVELTDRNRKQYYIPRGFAHGVLSLEDNTEVSYMTDEYWVREADKTIRYDDPDINIKYPIVSTALILSERDKKAPLLRDSGCNL